MDSADRASLTHTFKNHLAVITGFCDLLLRDLPPEDRNYGAIAEMRRAAEAALALLPRLLDEDREGS